jgi:predicted metal-dependent phosphoesterase TrpH
MREAAAAGLSAIALTDHDTAGGLDEARAEAEKLGIRFIAGIEIAVNWTPGEFHLLGLGIKPDAAFLEAVARIGAAREQRNREIVDKMNSLLHLQIDYEEVTKLSGGDSVGRPHFARILAQRKIVKNTEQAFDRYLAKGRPLYAPKRNMDFAEAAALVKDAGGIAALAHPMSLYVAWGRLPALIASLQEQGLDGIEAWHPTAKPRECRRLEALGKQLGLYITAGSDFHGENRAERKLGRSAGGRKIEDAVLEAIPPLYQKM